MGCGNSSEIPKTGESDIDVDFLKDYLSLTNSDINLLKKSFHKIDLHGSGTVDFDEFCVRIKCEPSIFLENIFGFFSSTQKGNYVGLNFAEFSLFVCFFLTLDENGVANYLYKILTFTEFNSHLTKQERLSIRNIEHNIKCLFGKDFNDPKKLHQTMLKMDSNKDGILSKEEFIECCLKNKSLLFPCISLQISMKERIISTDYWERKTGLGNRLLGTIRDIRDDLHNLLRDQRRQRRHPSLAEGEVSTTSSRSTSTNSHRIKSKSTENEDGIEASNMSKNEDDENEGDIRETEGNIKPTTKQRADVIDVEI